MPMSDMTAAMAAWLVMMVIMIGDDADRCTRRLRSLAAKRTCGCSYDDRRAVADHDELVRCGRNDHAASSIGRVGIASVIASACASLRSGATPVEAFETQSGRRFAVARLTESRVRALLVERALPKESTTNIDAVAREIAVAARLSDALGCPMAQCLETVGAAYRRSRLLDDLRAQSFAVPQATVRLLSALPAVTVLFGEFLGARPMAFLLGSAQGWGCLTLGAICYAIGMAWMRAMMRDAG